MQRREWYAFLGVLLFGALLLFPGLGGTPLIDWDENIYAEASRQMVVSGNYLNVRLNNHPFAEKPPLFFWMQSLSYHLWGINEFAARFPSAISGMLLGSLCFFVGRRLHSLQLGVTWATVYLSSLLPGIFARSAVIDHTFNLFIATATFSLYFYDLAYKKYLEHQSSSDSSFRSKYRFWLTLATVAMGVAVLTKGPLGGVIPLLGFASYKFAYRTPKISIPHFFFCGIVSLSIATSWYWVNWILYGSQFLENFIRFQMNLFSKPLEGHSGPFYYHWVVVLFGVFPWTFFLAFLFRKPFQSSNPHLRPLLFIGTAWCFFVLILFSWVNTKLPHYSASVYIPLSLFIAWVLTQVLEQKIILPSWLSWLHAAWGTLIAAGLMSFPVLAENYIRENIPQQEGSIVLQWSTGIYWTAAAFLATFLIGSLLLRSRTALAIGITAFSMIFLVQGLWRYQVPMIQGVIQTPMLALVEEAKQKQHELVFYRYVSFAALFYGKQPIEMLYTDKFPGNPDILKNTEGRKFSVITEQKHQAALEREFPALFLVKQSGNFLRYETPDPTTPKEKQ